MHISASASVQSGQGLSIPLIKLTDIVTYSIYPKYPDTSPYRDLYYEQIQFTIRYCLKIAGWVANSVDPDEKPRSAASHLGLHCLLRPVCPNADGKCIEIHGNGYVVLKLSMLR